MEPRRPRNVMLIIPELSMGGAQRSLTNLSLELAKENNVWLVIFDRDHIIPYHHGGELISLDVQGGRTWFKKIASLVKRVSRLRALKRILDIQVSLSYLEGADYVNILSRVTDRIVISIRGSKYFDQEINGVTGWIRLNLLMPLLYRKADHVVCVSEGIREEMIERMGLPAETTTTIHNFYDMDSPLGGLYHKSEDRFKALMKCPFILGIGRLHPQKNFQRLIQVYSHFRGFLPDFKLVILGEGEERENLKATCERSGLRVFSNSGGPVDQDSHDVFLVGFQNPAPFLEHTRLYVLSSLWEGFPNSLIEAMACGAVTVSADCPTGPREIVAPGSQGPATAAEYAVYGVLLPLLNSTEHIRLWAEEIVKLLEDSGRLEYYKTSGRRRAKNFAAGEILSQWNALIE